MSCFLGYSSLIAAVTPGKSSSLNLHLLNNLYNDASDFKGIDSEQMSLVGPTETTEAAGRGTVLVFV